MEVSALYGLPNYQCGQEWRMLQRSITTKLLWGIWNGLYGNLIKLCESAVARIVWRIALRFGAGALYWAMFKEELDFGGAQVPELKSRCSSPLYWLTRHLEWSEHYPALVTLLSHGEAGTRSLRLVLGRYNRKVGWVTAAQLLRVCAHQRKVDGSSLQMCTICFWKADYSICDWC